jgi:hypothetical protein
MRFLNQKTAIYLLFGLLLISYFSCREEKEISGAMTANELHQLNQGLIEISMEDVYNPPIATRIFAYSNMAAFEVNSHRKGKSFMAQHTGDSLFSVPTLACPDYDLAALFAFCEVSKSLVFSEYMVDTLYNRLSQKAMAKGQSETTIKACKEYATNVADQMKSWIKKDNYKNVKSGDQYSIHGIDSTWALTPPDYAQALEPNWYKLRPFVIKSPTEFLPSARPAFSKDKGSDFFKNATMVMDEGNLKDSIHQKIALYWDDNPNEFNDSGHNTHFKHKVSPPAHWINITHQYLQNAGADLSQSFTAYSAVSVAMFDGMITCWGIKYRENLIRPVTYINRYLDKNWKPLIQTPPFPEYTSGHSTVSGSASIILENLYPNTPVTDSTEVPFGFEARSFKNANEAGREASDSRFYGGIHYKFGVDNGFANGNAIGLHILNTLTKFK